MWLHDSCSGSQLSGMHGGGQAGFDLGAKRLFPRRKFQRASEISERFVNVEAWFHRGDLEQNASRLAEVDGLEVLPIPHRRHLPSELHEVRANAQLLL